MGFYDGWTRAQLENELAALNNVYTSLRNGQQTASASYSQGDGSRSVTYRQSDGGLQRVLADINDVKLRLGIGGSRRRSIRFVMS